jgi:DNA-binding response OmpR family regulator
MSHPELRKALAIAGDPEDRRFLASLLAPAEIDLVQCTDGGSGLKAFHVEHPDIVVLDLDLEDIDGLDLLVRIRELSGAPVVLVTGPKGREGDMVRCLRAGADDCLTKPIDGAEMLARIEAIMRRTRADARSATVLDDEFIRIDRLQHRVEVLGAEVPLTPTEFRLLATFAENPGRVLGHTQLLELVWGNGMRARDEVKLYVSYLRRKLNEVARVDPVETVRGVGYRYRPRRIPISAGAPVPTRRVG